MPNEEMEKKDREAYEVSDMIRSAANLVEQAIRNDDPTSKKALQNAAKVLMAQATARMDESVGTSDADDEE